MKNPASDAPVEKRRVLVTGAEGFTGKYLVDELVGAGYAVFGIGTRPAHSDTYRQIDLLDIDALRSVYDEWKPQITVHLAALAFVGHGSPNDFYSVNIIGTRNLLQVIDESATDAECVVLASSANVYGNIASGLIDESAPVQPANDYAVSKLGMELMARTWMKKIPIVITRPFNSSGVGQAANFLLPKIVSHFRDREPRIELGNLDVWRDFSDVRAVVKAYRGLIEACPQGQTFNISSGTAYSLREVLAMCEKLSGHSLRVEVNPAFVRQNEVRKLCGDSTRLRELLPQWSTPPLIDTLDCMLRAAEY